MKATIYIPEEKAKLYEEAKEKLSDSISETFVRCLETALANKRIETERIIVEIENPENGRITKKAFEGRWLLEDETHQFDYEATGIRGGDTYSVALTKRGALAVVTDRSFELYPGLEDLKRATDGSEMYPRYPESLVNAVASELGEDRIEELDI